MSKSQWLALLALFLGYLLLGATVFMHLESSWERKEREELADIRASVHEILLNTKPVPVDVRLVLLSRVEEICGKPLMNASKETPPRWNLYNSFFFAFTVVTTIGYGNLSPTTPWSRVFCIAFALLGIPLNGILLATLAEFFTQRLVVRREKWKQRGAPRSTQTVLLVDGLFYLLPLFLVFILLPAGLFVALEGWSFLDAIYFAFVSLTTIGFGDFVAGMTSGGPWLWVYKILLVCWIVFGLGYLLMILGLITQALRSKRLRKLRRRLRMRSAASGQLRRLLNELYVIRLQRVYKPRGSNSASVARRASQPCPGGEPNSNQATRRATDAGHMSVLGRTHSDSDLNHIDMGATFAEEEETEETEALGHLLRSLINREELEQCGVEDDPEAGMARRASVPPGHMVPVNLPAAERKSSGFVRILRHTSMADFLQALHQLEQPNSRVSSS